MHICQPGAGGFSYRASLSGFYSHHLPNGQVTFLTVLFADEVKLLRKALGLVYCNDFNMPEEQAGVPLDSRLANACVDFFFGNVSDVKSLLT